MRQERYNRGARALHWSIAVLVMANLAGGLLHEPLEDVVNLIPAHKAIGMTVLALTLVRIGWRLTWRAPSYPDGMSRAAIGAAHGIHAAFYMMLLAMPLTGWIVASAGKYPLTWFGLFAIPKLAVKRADPAYLVAHEAHEVLGWLFLALVLVHVAAALRHHFVLRDGVLARMA